MRYYAFENENGEEYGSFEVFYVSDKEASDPRNAIDSSGWYWWACFPGCMPDGEPCGPFATEDEAIQNAQES